MSAATRPARSRWRPVVLACGLWALVLLGLVATAWLNHLLRRAGRPDLAERGADPVPTALAALSAATVGAVVASRRPSHPVGWLLLGLGLSVPWSDVLDGYVDYGCWPGQGRCRQPATWRSTAPPSSWPGWPARGSFCC